MDIIAEHGVKDVVCSPGSRNTPLIIAAAARENLRKHVIVDERSAAFVALGMALVSRRPVALVCTSGTALLNYAPAVAEAYYQGIPLIVITADRPKEWIDQDDSQTIKQPYSLANIVKETYDISDREQCDGDGWYENRVFNDAMLTALRPKQGPVHINLRLSNPLQSTVEFNPDAPCRIIGEIHPAPVPSRDDIKRLAASLVGKKVLIVAGFMNPDSRLNKGMLRMAAHNNVCVMAETLSNLHLPAECYAIDSTLCTLDDTRRQALAPDVVISVGGALVSRMLKTYLRRCAAENHNIIHWSVGHQHTTVDCFQNLSLRIEADPGQFINSLSAELQHQRKIAADLDSESEAYLYSADWSMLRLLSIRRMDSIAGEARWSDLRAFDIIMHNIDPDVNLFLSNGTAVRYAQICTRILPHACYCNRGVSGIEGSTSTALGASLASPHPTWIITGDTSFAHDIGALAANVTTGSSLKIIVINNKGGGIFRFISTTSRLECREEYFCANPALDISKVAPAFGFSYLKAENPENLEEAMTRMKSESGPAILEISTPPEQSAKILRKALNIK